MINQFGNGPSFPGVPQTFNTVLETVFEGIELNSPMIPLPEQIITLDANETYSVDGIQPSSIINANAGGATINFITGTFGAEPSSTRRSCLIIGTNLTITAGITFTMRSGPCLLIGYGGAGWRALNIGSNTVSGDMAEGVYSKRPANFDTDVTDSNDAVNEEIRRFLKIETFGDVADYQRVIDGPSTLGFAPPSVTYPAPPLQAGVTTLPIEAWKREVHRVREIPSGTAAASIELDLSAYTTDLVESGESSTAFIHFEQIEATTAIPFTFVNMPAGMSWGIDPADVFGAGTQDVISHYSIRIDRIGNTLIPSPFCSSI